MIYLLSCTTTPQEDSKKEITEIVDNDVQDTQDPPQDTAPPQEPSIEIDPQDVDDDGDGFTENQGDCDDSQASIYPEAPEIAGDNIDQDCDGVDFSELVRFIALGDAGEGNDNQFAVGAAIKTICDAKTDDSPGCLFAIYLGDNFYESGVDGVSDPQFQTKFEEPYADLDFPFYIAMGNHDYGGDCFFSDCGGLGNEFERSEAQIEYSDMSDKWTMPDVFYTFVQEHVQFYALDTTALMWDGWWWDDMPEGQEAWFSQETAQSDATWKIAFGHHPYISNGRHGNAGSYEGLDWSGFPDALVGDYVQEFMELYVCGEMDIMFSGHDHNRQWLEPTCGTEFIVSGAGAKTTDLEGRGNPTFFEDDQKPGFMWIEIRDNCMTGSFYDDQANLDFTQQVCKEDQKMVCACF